jgi:hypothetical protein
MALLTVQEQISTLLQRNLVEDKTKGTPSVQVEAAAVMDSVALNFVFNPRITLYFAHLARNALLKLATDECNAALALMETIRDLGNQSYALHDLKALERAKSSLLQIETQGQILSTEGAFKGFDSAAKEFLDKQLSKNVRRQGTQGLVRPSIEAAAALPGDYATLKSLHAQVDSRLGYLTNGVRAFSTSSIAGTLGLNAAFRVRKDIESIISDLETDPTAAGSREYAIRISAARTALRLLGTPPGVFDPKVSTQDSLPYGYSLHGVSAVEPLTLTSSLGPWPVSYLTPFVVTKYPVAGAPQVTSKSFALTSSALMIGTISSTWTIPPQGGLFFSFSGVPVRVVLNSSTSSALKTAADVAAAINAQAGGYVQAEEIWETGGSRVGIWSHSGLEFSLTDLISEDHSGSTSGSPTLWTNSMRELLGLPNESTDHHGTLSAVQMKDCLDSLLGTSGAIFDVDGDYLVMSVPLLPGETFKTSIPCALPAPIFDSPAVPAVSSSVVLVGTYLGKAVTPSAYGLVAAGDTLSSPTGKSAIASVADTLTLTDSLPIFDGPITITSGLVLMWQPLQLALDAFESVWAKDGSIARLDTVIAPLYGSPTLARRNDAMKVLQVLVDTLQSLQTVLSSYPVSSDVSVEKAIAEGIMSTLTERKFDRAQSFLLQGQFVEVFSLDWQTASFSGELLAAATDVAQNDLNWPRVNNDEQVGVPYATDDSLEVQ